MNPLITNINAHVEVETLAPMTTIQWDPINNTGSITYQCSDYYRLTSDDTYFGQPAPAGGYSFSLQEVMQESVDIEVAPGVFQQVPMMLVAGAIKAHFKKKMEEIRRQS